MNRWELKQKLALKALKDPAFKSKLLARPNETVREFLQNEKADNLVSLNKINFKVIEEKKGEWVLTLPMIEIDVSTVTDAELERIAAGGTSQAALICFTPMCPVRH